MKQWLRQSRGVATGRMKAGGPMLELGEAGEKSNEPRGICMSYFRGFANNPGEALRYKYL